MTQSVCLKLDAVLTRLAADTLARAATARFARVAETGRIISILQLTPQARLAAAMEYERFRRWLRGISAVLDRRGASPSSRRIELLAADLEPLVRCTRKDVAEIPETHWRRSYAADLADIVARLSALIHQHAGAFELVRIPTAQPYEAVDISIVPGDECVLPRADAQPVAEYGRQLYDAAVRHGGSGIFEPRGAGMVRYRLWLGAAGALAAARWELLHDGREFIALRRAASLTRAVAADGVATADAPSAPPLRLLVTISAPQGVDALDAEGERAALEQALGALVVLGLAEVEFAPDGSLESLRRQLRAAADSSRPFHVWHFIGHGAYDPSTDSSALLMESVTKGVHRVGGDELGLLLRSYGPLSNVVLNCCHGGRGTASTPNAAPARALVTAGVPSVVAMQTTIRDDAAGIFAEELYGALCDGRSIDEAVAEGRRRLFLSPGAARHEWATPVLFVAAPTNNYMATHRSGRPPQ